MCTIQLLTFVAMSQTENVKKENFIFTKTLRRISENVGRLKSVGQKCRPMWSNSPVQTPSITAPTVILLAPTALILLVSIKPHVTRKLEFGKISGDR